AHPFFSDLSRLVFPVFTKPHSSHERVGVAAGAAGFRYTPKLFGMTASDHHVVWTDYGNQPVYDFGDVFSPSPTTEPFQTAKAHIIFVSSLLIREVTQLHWHHYSIRNQRGSHA